MTSQMSQKDSFYCDSKPSRWRNWNQRFLCVAWKKDYLTNCLSSKHFYHKTSCCQSCIIVKIIYKHFWLTLGFTSHSLTDSPAASEHPRFPGRDDGLCNHPGRGVSLRRVFVRRWRVGRFWLQPVHHGDERRGAFTVGCGRPTESRAEPEATPGGSVQQVSSCQQHTHCRTEWHRWSSYRIEWKYLL